MPEGQVTAPVPGPVPPAVLVLRYPVQDRVEQPQQGLHEAEDSGPPGIRTLNLKVKSQLLCAFELAARGSGDGI